MKTNSNFSILGYEIGKKDFVIFWLLVILFFSYRSCESLENRNKGYAEGYKTYLKEKQTWRDKEGKLFSKIETLTSDNLSFILESEHKDSSINRLKEEIKKYKSQIKKQGSITIVDTQGEASGTVVTTVDTTKNRIEFTSDFNFKGWVWGSTIANKDSTQITIKYKDRFTVVVGEEKTGFLGLGKKKPFSIITSENPYTEIKEQKTYQTTLPSTKKFGVGVIAGFTVGPNFIISPSVGVGASYNFIRF